MIQPGDSWYKLRGFAGTTRNWIVSDTEELYQENFSDPAYRKQLEEYGWNDTSITYKFNSEGFRSDEFNLNSERDSVVFLGCSFTMGVGIPFEDSWTYRVSRELNLRCYNLGVGGTSADGCFRLARHWIPILKPKYVCLLTPALGRMELLDETDIHGFLPMRLVPLEMREKLYRATKIIKNSGKKDSHSYVESNTFYETWITNEINTVLNREKNQLAIQQICEKNNVCFFQLTTEETGPIFNPKGFNKKSLTEKARDLIHPGREWNKQLSEKFLGMIQEKY